MDGEKRRYLILRSSRSGSDIAEAPLSGSGSGRRTDGWVEAEGGIFRGGQPIQRGEGGGFAGSVEELDGKQVAEISREDGVEAIAPSMGVKLVRPTENGYTGEEAAAGEGVAWGIAAVGAERSPFNGTGVRVAVLDTGIDAAHDAFADVPLEQQDFTGEGNGDGNGHGTHCAGTIFGRDRDGFRYGVARGIEKALIGKVLNRDGAGSTEQIMMGLKWAAEQRAEVISISLGIDFPGLVRDLKEQGFPVDMATSIALESYRQNVRLFDRLAGFLAAQGDIFERETLVIAAAGNESRRDIDPRYVIGVSPPANADGFLSVGALGRDNEAAGKLTLASFSNTGVALSGPGVGIFSAKPGGGYTIMSGTSMATPYVAGVAALWAQKLKQVGSFRGRSRMLASKLLALASKDDLAADIDMAGVGAGLARAPMG